jgi:hypothetical protein
MGGISVGRWLAGGFAAALVIFVMEGALSSLYADRMGAVLAEHGLSAPMSARTLILAALISLLMGLVIVFIYAAGRMRFGQGPRTGIIAALAVYFAGYLPTLIGYAMIGLYPTDLLWLWGAQGLIELTLAGIVGAWIYKEDPTRLGMR